MGRKPIGKRAMTPAERQKRHRARLRKAKDAEWMKKERLKRRQENARRFMPTPPGTTYWRKVRVMTPEGEQEIWAPLTRPLAACETDLEDEDIQALLSQLHKIAAKRGIPIPTTDAPSS